jgi:VanZ family protein
MSGENQNGYVRVREFDAGIKNLSDKMDEIKKIVQQQKSETDQDVQRVHHRVDAAENRLNQVEISLSSATTKSDASERKWERVFWVILAAAVGLVVSVIQGGG